MLCISISKISINVRGSIVAQIAKKSTTKKAATKKSATVKSTTKKTAAEKTKKSVKNTKTSTASGKSAKNDGNNKKLKSLIIVESPTKARTLERFSKGKYIVKASMGHVRDLPKTSLGVNVDDNYEPKYITIRGKKTVIDDLRKGVKKASKVFLASDPDREGEAIAWHLAELLKVEKPLRVEMHEITKTAFDEALKNPREIDANRVNAQQARRVLDRLVGYNLSPLLWRKISDGLSAGRVQSVAVKLICDRQKEIDAFEPEEYWSINVLASKLKDSRNNAFDASLVKKQNQKVSLPDKKTTDEVLNELKKSKFTILDIKKKDQNKNPSPPYKTSTLQQDAHSRLGFSAKKTMLLAQQLYEGIDIGSEGTIGLITYMRTDSAKISETARKEASEYITKTYGKEYSDDKRYYKSSTGAQEAHEAIRPTSIFRDPEKMRKFLRKDQYRLYQIIWDRFTASQMTSAIMENVSVDIQSGDYLFRATDSKVKFPGYLKIYQNEDTSKEEKSKKSLPELQKGEELKVHEYNPKQHFTQPPPAYTEASLIKTLEEKGIGRPSTYAPIVDTIQRRNYVMLIEKKFQPTELGMLVNEMLEQYFPNILDVDFTAEMEGRLDMVEEGKEEWHEVINNFYKPFHETLVDADSKIPKVELEPEETGEMCEKCGKPLVIKNGRFGKFVACSGYPECRTTKPLLKEIGVPCPAENCGGQLIEKKSKKGVFFGCSNYPKCNFASWDKPINELCSRCGKVMVLRYSRSRKSYKACMDYQCRKN
jgi:DNA topoisomerase I